MIKQFTLAAAALAMGATAVIPATPAAAQRYGDRYYGDRYDRGYGNRYNDGRYYDRGYRDNYNYRARQKCKDGDGGTIIGAFVIGILSDGLVMMGVSSFWQMVIKGLVIIIAVVVDQAQRRLQQRVTLMQMAKAG